MKENTQNLELILLDKCTIQSLTDEELGIVSKHKILVPSIVLIENLKRHETIKKISKLENTYHAEHWSILAKDDLLDQDLEIAKGDITEITDNPTELENYIKIAKDAAEAYDKFPQELQERIPHEKLSFEHNMDLVISRFKELDPNIKIPHNLGKKTKVGIKKRGSLFTINQGDWREPSLHVINDLNNKPIRKENRHLKEEQRTYIRNKEWIDFACDYLGVTEAEKFQIFKNWTKKGHKNLKFFAPYAYYVLALELTIALYILKSNGNYKKEIMRDLEYLYYAHYANVTFHTCDGQLKDTIHKIPFLSRIEKKMVYFYNDKENRPGELNKSDWLKTLEN